MKYVAYHRTSTKEQKLDRGINELTKYCSDNNIKLYKNKVFTDQSTGKNFERPTYQALKNMVLDDGDCLIVTELDRLGRNKEATLKEMRYFKEHNIRIMILELPTTLIDLSGESDMAKMMLETINNMMIELYASMAQAEMQKRTKRQQEGIQAKAIRQAQGTDTKNPFGRPRAIDYDSFKKVYDKVIDGSLKPFEAMQKLKMKKATFYRYKKLYEEGIKDKGKL